MVPAEIQDALLDELKSIGPENGKQLLEMARSMKGSNGSKKRTFDEILRDLPVWDEERAREMEEIIEAGCEQIDHSDIKPKRLRGSRIEDIMKNIVPMDHESAEEMRRIIEEDRKWQMRP